MPWYIFALCSALLASAAALTEKKMLSKEHSLEFSAALAWILFLISSPLFFFLDYHALQVRPLMILFGYTVLTACAFVCVAKAVRRMELSEVSPMLLWGPALTALLAFVTLGEALTLMQSMGIALLLVGAYFLELRQHHWLRPFQVMWQSRAMHWLLWGLVLYSIGSLFDRYLLAYYRVPPLTFTTFAHAFLAFHFLIMMMVLRGSFSKVAHIIRQNDGLLIGTAFLVLGYRFVELFAIQAAPVGLAVSVKHMSALFTTIIGGELFHENNLPRKVVAAVIMFAGMLLIILK